MSKYSQMPREAFVKFSCRLDIIYRTITLALNEQNLRAGKRRESLFMKEKIRTILQHGGTLQI